MNIRSSEGFIPPAGFVRWIRSALDWIDPVDLAGIDFVLLFDDVPPFTPGKNPDLAKAIREGLLLFGAYKARNENWPAHVMLITRNLCQPIPPLLQRSPAMTLWIAETIAHEVGHHVIAERRFALRPKTDGTGIEDEEEFADRYAESIMSKMKSRLRYRFGDFLLGLAAEANFQKGARSWKQGQYQTAAHYFYLTTQLRPDHKEASYWFYWAEEKAAGQDASNVIINPSTS
jgi:hypothetical protein